MKPVSEPRSGVGPWQPVAVAPGMVSVTGGYGGKTAQSAPAVQYSVDGAIHLFVELDKNAAWYLKGVGGRDVQKGDLKAVDASDVLRAAFNEKIRSVSAEEASPCKAGAVADDSQEVDDIDPMDAMDDLPLAVTPTRKRLRTKKGEKSAKEKADDAARACRAAPQALEVPMRPTCTGVDVGSTTVVWAYWALKSSGKGKFYLRSDCLDWLLSYSADEYNLQGVDVPVEEAAVAAPNRREVDDLRMDFDFDLKQWDGEFVAGALKGTKRTVALSHITKTLWEQMKARTWTLVPMSKSTMTDKKNAAEKLVLEWCSALSRNAGHDFERWSGLSERGGRGSRGLKRLADTDADEPDDVAEDATVAAEGAAEDDDDGDDIGSND